MKPLNIEITGASGDIEWSWYSGYTAIDTGIITPMSGSGSVASFSAAVDSNMSAEAGGVYRLVVKDATGCKA